MKQTIHRPDGYDPRGPCLILAPHLVYPAHNGSDISLDRLGRHLSAFTAHVTLVGAHEVVRFEGGQEVHREAFDNALRSKSDAGARTLAFRSHFYLEKFNTPAYTARAQAYLKDPAYHTVLCSYITTLKLLDGVLPPPHRLHLAWTHNDEFKWFRELRHATRNPLGKLAAYFSEQWLHRFFDRYSRRAVFLHVTDADRDGFKRYYPRHEWAIIPIGVDLPPSGARARGPGLDPVRLLFVGSLGVKMNHDALLHFATRYEPEMRRYLGKDLAVDIAGSNPSAAVASLCNERGWRLHADVSDEALHRLFVGATFSLLPFDYATGAKLKLLNSLAHGVPFLATDKVSAQADACFPPSLIADNPDVWMDRVREVQARGITDAERNALRTVARQHSWEASARKVFDAMQARAD